MSKHHLSKHKHGKVHSHEEDPSRYDASIEEKIAEEVDQKIAAEDQSSPQLLSQKTRRAKYAQEIRDGIEMPELSQHVAVAVNILRNEGENYLENKDASDLKLNLRNLYHDLSTLSLETMSDKNFKLASLISPHNLTSILKVGIAKYNEGLLDESLSIFAFLSAINPENPDYWYRLGVVAQQEGQYELALRAFASTSRLVPEFIATRIFSAECYISLHMIDDALAELAEAKHILKTVEVEEKWAKHITDIENLLAAFRQMKEG